MRHVTGDNEVQPRLPEKGHADSNSASALRSSPSGNERLGVFGWPFSTIDCAVLRLVFLKMGNAQPVAVRRVRLPVPSTVLYRRALAHIRPIRSSLPCQRNQRRHTKRVTLVPDESYALNTLAPATYMRRMLVLCCTAIGVRGET